jgi:hypothetical protein
MTTTNPTVSIFSPTADYTHMGVSDNIVITFDKAIQKATGKIVLKTSAGKIVETFKIATSTAVSISDDTLIINPSKDLKFDTKYKLEIASGAITDTSHNPYTGLTGYHFTTTDTLTTSASSYTLGSNAPKKLAYSGTGDFIGTGNRSANEITSGVGNDILNGVSGNDTLTGGSGADKFVFNTKPGKTNIDTIIDFITGIDKMVLEYAIFRKLSPAIDSSDSSALDADQLVIGTAALDGNDYLIYNSASGALFYDADGSGKSKAVGIAVIGSGLDLTSNDFVLNRGGVIVSIPVVDTSIATPVTTPDPTPVTTPDPTPVTTPDPTPVTTPDPTPVTTPDPTPVTTPDPTPVTTPGIFSISADGTSTATPGADTFNVAAGTYTHNINGFNSGDKINFFAGSSLTVIPDNNDNDGTQLISASDAVTQTTTTITLTGLTMEQDAGLFNVPSFATVFGAGTIS